MEFCSSISSREKRRSKLSYHPSRSSQMHFPFVLSKKNLFVKKKSYCYMKSSPEMNLLPPDAACHPSPIQFPMKKRHLSQFVNPSFFVKGGEKKGRPISNMVKKW